MPQELDILVLGLHEDAVEAFALRRLCRGAGACERVKDRAARRGDVADQVLHEGDRLDGRVLRSGAVFLARFGLVYDRIGVGRELVEEAGCRARVSEIMCYSIITLPIGCCVVVLPALWIVWVSICPRTIGHREQRHDLWRAVEYQVGGVAAFDGGFNCPIIRVANIVMRSRPNTFAAEGAAPSLPNRFWTLTSP